MREAFVGGAVQVVRAWGGRTVWWGEGVVWLGGRAMRGAG